MNQNQIDKLAVDFPNISDIEPSLLRQMGVREARKFLTALPQLEKAIDTLSELPTSRQPHDPNAHPTDIPTLPGVSKNRHNHNGINRPTEIRAFGKR